jgi:hypothetical protein
LERESDEFVADSKDLDEDISAQLRPRPAKAIDPIGAKARAAAAGPIDLTLSDEEEEEGSDARPLRASKLVDVMKRNPKVVHLPVLGAMQRRVDERPS